MLDNDYLNFDLKLIELDVEELVVEDTVYDCTLLMSSKIFKTICSDLAKFSESIGLSYNNNELKLEFAGDFGDGHLLFEHTADLDLVLKKSRKIQFINNLCNETIFNAIGDFGLNYLNMVIKATPLNDFVRFGLKNGSCLVAEYDIKCNDECSGSVSYYLAPKVDDDN